VYNQTLQVPCDDHPEQEPVYNYRAGAPVFGNGLEVGALHSRRRACGGPSHQGLSCQELAVNGEENEKILYGSQDSSQVGVVWRALLAKRESKRFLQCHGLGLAPKICGPDIFRNWAWAQSADSWAYVG